MDLKDVFHLRCDVANCDERFTLEDLPEETFMVQLSEAADRAGWLVAGTSKGQRHDVCPLHLTFKDHTDIDIHVRFTKESKP